MFRCTSLRNKHSSCQQMSATNERLNLPPEQHPADNTKPKSEHQLFTFLFKAYSVLFCLHEAHKLIASNTKLFPTV